MKSPFLRLLFYILLLGVGMGAAFGAGVAYGKVGTTTTTTAADASRRAVDQAAAAPSNPGEASGPAGAGSGRAGAAAAMAGGSAMAAMGARPVVTGTVDSVASDGLTVASGQGQTTKVTLGQRASVAKDVAITDLKKGDRVSVIGQRGSDGNVIAALIQVLPAN